MSLPSKQPPRCRATLLRGALRCALSAALWLGGAGLPASAAAPPQEAAPSAAPPPMAQAMVPPQIWAAAQSALCTAAIQQAETRYQLPPGLLGTIAKVESGRPVGSIGDVRAWPWTIDADGQGFFFESRAAAVAWARQGLARGVNFMDVGCMQVDLQMHPGAFRDLDEAFDPVRNADYAARYLRSLHQGDAGGDWNVAVGLYHSHTPELAAAYRDRVAAVGAGIVTGIGGPQPLYMRAIRQGTLRLALAGGGVLLINVNRQPASRLHRRMNTCQVAFLLGDYAPARLRGCRSAR
ncbi:MAG: transglycosylase SLT domain-containing protein [Acidisphaera sp.]|nr:transglycosylase SLT domain-containing protein [Acidisphaera sp.]